MRRLSGGRGRCGFTMLETMIVVSIIGLLAVIAMPMFMHARVRSQNVTFLNCLRLAGDAFHQYAMEKGDFPRDAPAGMVPAGMPEYMPRHLDWTAPTSIGGAWKWNRAPLRGQLVLNCCYAGISVEAPARTTEEMTQLDKEIDDGDLDAGAFRRCSSGYVFILQKE
jgi:prepilin-type N-terminal cleavage/methylation domain-containing protein